MRRKLSFLLFVVLLGALPALAQTEIKGIVVDKDTKEPLIGVSIFAEASKSGTATDLDGSFTLKVPSIKGQIEFSYVGYKTMKVDANANMGTIEMKTDAIGLQDVVVTSSIAIRRKTPVAVSVIETEMLEAKLSVQEFPEILKSTPGIYATKQGGGYGDSRVNLRGFESPNIAVMINGIPMNDMEWGGVYWSNWAGLSDVTRSMQVQRGLGASKVSAPSVGGSINVVTRSTDAEKGGSAFYSLGNDGYNKISFSVSTGLTSNGWAVTLLGAKSWGDGYVLGTDFKAYSYFLNVSKIINADHQLSFTAFGAPQEHYQRNRNDKMLITEWQKVQQGYKYNPTYGFGESGVRKSSSYNRSHKPQISLNHSWTMTDKSSLSSSVYLSLCDAAGNAWRGKSYNDLYGVDNKTGKLNTGYRTLNGFMDYAKLQKENAAEVNGPRAVLTESRNNHVWTGLISTYTTRFGENIDFYGGIDLRYYEGLHDSKIIDLMGGNYFIDNTRANVKDPERNTGYNFENQKLKVGDIVYRDNTGYILQEGIFSQIEYNKEALSVFVSGAASNHTYWKRDRFYYGKTNEKSDSKSFLAGNFKGGANYNLTDNHNVYFNTGIISRAPFMSGGYFTNIHTSNVVNPNAVNEKIYSVELGYGYKSRYLTANVNLYHTIWKDKTMTVRSASGDDATINLEGVNARHQGLEIDLVAKPFKDLDITAMLSLGDWMWTSNASGYQYNKDGQAINNKGQVVDPLSPEHSIVGLNLKDVRVGNSAQTTFALGAKYRFLKDFMIGADYTYYGRNYADFQFNASDKQDVKYRTPWMMPAAGIVDMFANYRFKIGGLNATLTGNINNLLDQERISDATDLDPTSESASWQKVAVMYDFGRTYSISLKVRF